MVSRHNDIASINYIIFNWLIDDMIGGNIYCALGMSLFTPLPKVDSDRFKGHLFVNAGTLRLVENGK
jgi:outer membrane protein assembly factor BamA